MSEQYKIPVVYYRGGTSKALFFKEKDVPAVGEVRDKVLKRCMGSPDPMQIDGMGGTNLTTSKIAIIKRSNRKDVDVDYTFAQVGIADDRITYDANCGNISSAVGPFAIDEGLIDNFLPGKLVDGKIPTQQVRIHCTGTDTLLVAHVPVNMLSKKVIINGDSSIDGCPGTGAPILLDWKETTGGTSKKGLLPTGNAVDLIEIDGKFIEVTLCDVGNFCIIVNAKDLGFTGNETKDIFDKNIDMVNKVHLVRRTAAVHAGLAKSIATADIEAKGFWCTLIVSETDDEGDVKARFILYDKCHTAMAGTGAICLAAASRVEGSVVNKLIKDAEKDHLLIQHPQGLMKAWVEKEVHKDNKFSVLAFERTARRIVDGHIYIPTSIWSGPEKTAVHNPIVTERLSQFVSNTDSTILFEHPELLTIIKQCFLDYIGLTGYASCNDIESSDTFINAINTLDFGGKSTAIGINRKYSRPYAAFLNGSFSHSMDFDDTCAQAAIHPGAPIISAALVEAEMLNVSGEEFLTAVAIGYEVACRLGTIIGPIAYDNGFHATSVIGIFGAVAAISKLHKFTSKQVESAFGVAISRASGSQQFLINGAWNKRIHPGFAAHDAIFSIELVKAGIISSKFAIEGDYGLFNNYFGNNNHYQYEKLIKNLGCDWVCQYTAIKPYPACRMTHSAIEGIQLLKVKYSGQKELKSIEIKINPVLYKVVGGIASNKTHPQNIVDAQFSIYYQIAATWIYGKSLGWKVYQHLHDNNIKSILDKITCINDTQSKLRIGCIISIEFTDGFIDTITIPEPSGEPSNPLTWQQIEQKFLSLCPFVNSNQKIINTVKTLETLPHLSNLISLFS